MSEIFSTPDELSGQLKASDIAATEAAHAHARAVHGAELVIGLLALILVVVIGRWAWRRARLHLSGAPRMADPRTLPEESRRA